MIRNPALVTACRTDQLFGFLDEAASLIPGSEKLEHPDPRSDDEIGATAQIILKFLDK